MSNALAIAAVTSTIRYVLERSLAVTHPGPVGGAGVTTVRPDRLSSDDLAGSAGINLFLYQVTPNHAGNLTDLPTRRPDGSLMRRPVAALDLHYLLTGYGEDPSLDGQRLLGRAIMALASSPVLTRDVIAAAVDAYQGDVTTAFLTDSDLAAQVEPVKLAPSPMSLEELSRLWSVFQRTPYQLSVAYRATVVLLEPALATRTALPVLTRGISVQAAGPSRLVSVEPATPGPEPPHGSPPPVVGNGTQLLLTGSGLRRSGPGTVTRVRIGPAVLDPLPDSSPEELRAVLTDDVPAGVHAVQVQHLSAPGPAGGPAGRVVAASNAVPLTVHPQIAVTGVTPDPGGTIMLAVSPPLAPRQRAAVRLDRLDTAPAGAPTALLVDVDPVAIGDPPARQVAIPLDDVPKGTWLVRIDVDGVDSVPELDGGSYRSPRVELA